MILRLLRGPAVATLLVLGASSCDLSTAPVPLNPIDVQIDFCSDEIPVWFAVQNQDDPWEVVQEDAAGTFSFTATDQVGIVYVLQNGADTRTEMIFTSNQDLERISGTACLEDLGTKQVNGTVSGVTGTQLAKVNMNFASALLTSSQASFSLTQLPDRPLDLLASRVVVSGGEQQATRTIIRRTLNPLDGALLPELDFAGLEAVATMSHTATIGGILPDDAAFLVNNFFSQLETSHTLTFIDAPLAGGQQPFVALPTDVLAAGDYHDLFVIATTTNDGVRGVERFFHDPANQAFVLGPALNDPTVTTAFTTPYVRLRTRLQAQVAYSTMLTLAYRQQTLTSATSVNLSVTASYFGGTPFFWDIVLPDLSTVAGWQNAWGLTTGAFDWDVTAYFGRPELIFGARPNEDETVNFATQMSSGTAMQAYRSGRVGPPRPRAFARNHSR